MPQHRIAACLLVLALLPATRLPLAHAEDLLNFNKPAAVMKWSAVNAPLNAAPGATVKLEIRGELPSGMYTYSGRPVGEKPVSLAGPRAKVKAGPPVSVGAPEMPPGKVKTDELGSYEIYDKTFTYTQPLTIEAGAPKGSVEVTLLIDASLCSFTEGTCELDRANPLTFTLNIGDKAAEQPAAEAGGHGEGAALPAVKWNPVPAVSGVRGEVVLVKVSGTVPAGYHTYPTKWETVFVKPSVFKAPEGAAFEVGGVQIYTGGKPYKSPLDVTYEVLEGPITFDVPVRIATNAQPGTQQTALLLDYQICNDENCFDQLGIKLPFELTVKEGAAKSDALPPPQHLNPADLPPATEPGKGTPAAGTATVKDSNTGEASLSAVERAKQEGLWAYIKIAALAGFTALFTPCVFPMIPITVSFFTKRKQATRADTIRDASAYAFGIVFAFTALGLLFTLVLGATGLQAFATNGYVNLFFGALFVLLAFSLFGAFEIQVPPALLNMLNRKAESGTGILSVLLMGAAFALTSFTCTVPFVGTVLISAAQGDFFWPTIGMLSFSTVFALPFVVLALFPALMKSLPKSGGWLNNVKVVMGFLEIAAAMKFFSNADLAWKWALVTREVFLAVWIGLGLLTTYYLLGRFQMALDTPVERIGAFRAVLAAVFLSASVWMTTGLFGGSLGELDAFAPPKEYPGVGSAFAGSSIGGSGGNGGAEKKLTWHPTVEPALEEGRKTNTPIFLDFTGYQCVNCRLMEERVFVRPEIHALLAKYVRAKLYTDGQDSAEELRISEANRTYQQQRFKNTALPLYAVLKPDGTVVATFSGFTREPAKFEAFLKQGLDASGVK